MKKFVPLMIFTALLGGLFSCKNGFDVQQRRYTSGFYVSHSGKKNSVEKQNSSAEKGVVTKENVKVNPSSEPEMKRMVTEEKIVMDQNKEQNNSSEPVSSKGNKKQNKIASASVEKSEHAVVSNEKSLKEEALKGKDTPAGGAQLDETGMFILMLVLSLLLPPLAVYLKQKSATKWFWVTLILCLLTGGVLYVGYLGSLWFIAFIIALLVVLDIIS
jgi:uncharacterized membrane protein YqaE (UPF0057 family)